MRRGSAQAATLAGMAALLAAMVARMVGLGWVRGAVFVLLGTGAALGAALFVLVLLALPVAILVSLFRPRRRTV